MKRFRSGKRLISFFLAAALLLISQEIPAVEISTDAPGRAVPKNPVHHYDPDPISGWGSDDTTEWSYIYFGSYPQTEVTGEELTDEIIRADYSGSGDASINGVKYRRISIEDTTASDHFGEETTYRYFKWENIKWRVLWNDGSTLFVMADQGIDCQTYSEQGKYGVYPDWETCHLREWLNADFYQAAFNRNERQAIVRQTVQNEDNPEYGTSGGNDTEDSVYLLSIQEASNESYGFNTDRDRQSASRRMKVSDYAYVMGAERTDLSYYDQEGWLWLRSPGFRYNYAAVIPAAGNIDQIGSQVDSAGGMCVPVLHIDLSSEQWSWEADGNGSNDPPGNDPIEPPADSMNPYHNCTEDTDDTGNTDETDWSYVYFGSYPQTEITGAALTAEITGAAYNSSGDAWVNGIKYRRISRADTTSSSNFGDGAYRYFKWERIRWRVLQDDGDTLFVIADQAVDCKRYHEQKTSVTWETSTIRKWLNETFYNAAFSGRERAELVRQSVINEENPYTGIRGGNNTRDFVYLLSFDEAIEETYGFCSRFAHSSASRRFQASEYAYRMGTAVGNNGSCMWWLRSPGGTTDGAVSVFSYGVIDHDDNNVRWENMGCIPVMNILKSSSLWQAEDDGTSGDGGEDPIVISDPVHSCTNGMDETGDTDTTEWDTVYFGSYPQTEVTGNRLTASIVNAAYNSNGDAWVNGTKYRRISRTDTNNDSFFGSQTYRYFKWERIKWRVLKNEGDALFIMADQMLDCKRYHNRRESVTWEGSSLRSWLNGTFYSMAFDGSEQKTILQKAVTNDRNPFNGTAAGNNTTDRIYLLSLSEAIHPEYGFCANEDLPSATRRMRPSDYAHIMGTTSFEEANGMGHWWLRSPGGSDSGAAEVFPVGQLNTDSDSVTWINIGCVPVMHITLRSGLWYSYDDGTSGSGGSHNEPGTVNPGQNPTNPQNPQNPTNSYDIPTNRLSAPGLSIGIASANAVKLTWTNISGASGYHIYRSTSRNGAYARIASVTSTSYTNAKLKKGATYYYRVSAYSGGMETVSGTVFRTIEGKPKKPKLSVDLKPSQRLIIFSWKGLKKQPEGTKIAIYVERKAGSRKVTKMLRAFPAKKKGKFIYRIKKGDRAFYGNAFYKRDGVKVSGKNTGKLNI